MLIAKNKRSLIIETKDMGCQAVDTEIKRGEQEKQLENCFTKRCSINLKRRF